MVTEYEYINTGRTVRLIDLILSEDIGGKDIINVRNAKGKLLARGIWNYSGFIDWHGSPGVASKAYTGIVNFKLVDVVPKR